MYSGQNIVVLDLEVLNSPDEVPSGWRNTRALGLSVGCYYSYATDEYELFDRRTLELTMRQFVKDQPLLVSFNGIGFDFKLMRALLRHEAEEEVDIVRMSELTKLCDQFKVLALESYDILAEIWAADPANKYVKGLNSLDAILSANGLPPKSGNGEEAPLWWREGKLMRVIEYCMRDVELTRDLFDLIGRNEGHIQRSSGPLSVRHVQDMHIANPAAL